MLRAAYRRKKLGFSNRSLCAALFLCSFPFPSPVLSEVRFCAIMYFVISTKHAILRNLTGTIQVFLFLFLFLLLLLLLLLLLCCSCSCCCIKYFLFTSIYVTESVPVPYRCSYSSALFLSFCALQINYTLDLPKLVDAFRSLSFPAFGVRYYLPNFPHTCRRTNGEML